MHNVMHNVWKPTLWHAGIVAAMLVVFLGAPGVAQEAGENGTPTKNNPNCKYAEVYDAINLEGEMTWSGTCLNGYTHGPGRLSSPLGHTEGHFVNGRLQGDGVLHAERSSEDESFTLDYTGEFKDSVAHGQGVMEVDHTRDGQRTHFLYKGAFQHAKRHGQGVMEFLTGSPIEGSRYEGEFQNGVFNGYGKLEGANGRSFEGEFKDDLPHGRGVLIYKDGSRYEGDMHRGDEHGRGILVNTDGSQYDGEFKDGRPNGHGVATFADGSTCSGEWKEGALVGLGNGSVGGRSMTCYTDGQAMKFKE